MSSFIKTQHEEKSCKRRSLRFSRSLRPKHSSEQQENQETQTTSIQQDLYIRALNKYARIEFLNKRTNEQKKRVKEQRQNDTVLFLYVDSLLGSIQNCSLEQFHLPKELPYIKWQGRNYTQEQTAQPHFSKVPVCSLLWEVVSSNPDTILRNKVIQ